MLTLENITQLNQINTASMVGVAVLDKSLETLNDFGNSMLNMIDKASMERSINPHIGSNFDMLV